MAQAKVTRVQAAFAKRLGIRVVDPPPGKRIDKILDVVRRRYRIQAGKQ
jgi:hypothetical protein